jgi:hypothetical protein
MRTLSAALKVLACAIFITALSSLAQAQATRTWVSGVGDDVNPCSRTAPCKTFAGAISKTAVNGEINVIDPGGFGAVTITKSMTIDGYGSQASILASGTTGVVVNLTTTLANDAVSAVRLRNLSINGTGSCGAGCGTRTGIRGINVSTSNTREVTLIVENTYIDGFVNEGILFSPPGGELIVINSTIVNNGTKGIMVDSKDANLARATITNSRIDRNQEGVRGETAARITIRESSMSDNTLNGAVILTAGASAAEMSLEGCVVSNNRQWGVLSSAASGAATIRISNNTITNNTGVVGAAGINCLSGGTVRSRQDNVVEGNTTNVLTCVIATIPNT